MSDRIPGSSHDETSSAPRRVAAKVKWFNATKGFGFVAPDDGMPDAFLPMAILRRAGYEDIREGASIICEIGAGAKGPLVTGLVDVDLSTALPRVDRRPPLERASALAGGASLDGAVKWFEPEKGYGFIAPDGGGKDIFIHITALRRSGLAALEPGARVRVDVIDGKKGLEADRITVI
jgi:CspA family cold shock protein